GATLFSDVFTVVDDRGAVWADLGRVSLELHLKDPGAASTTITPSATNSITLDRYHVSYARADGRNTPGVDVPYAFDGALTFTVSPDVLALDGASQSLVTITARDAVGNGVRNLSMRAEISVGGVRTDFGSISARNLVTDSNGRATLVYTAPAAPSGPAVDPDM